MDEFGATSECGLSGALVRLRIVGDSLGIQWNAWSTHDHRGIEYTPRHVVNYVALAQLGTGWREE
jgi:hypothetical protein